MSHRKQAAHYEDVRIRRLQLGLPINQRRCQVQDPVTYFSQFNGALKLLASNYEEDSQVDARVESWLQLKTLSVPAGGG